MLEATGKSFISNICVDLRFLRQQSVAGGGAALDQVVAEISDVKRAVEHLTSVVETCPAFAAEKSNQQSSWRIGYLCDSFRFPIGLSVQDAWFRWHDREKPLRAITAKMLPSSLSSAERARQCVLRRKMKGVMQILQGSTPDKTVDVDPIYVWSACWARCVAAFRIREPCSSTVTTFYDFLLKNPDCCRSAREAPAISFAEASAAAAATTADTAKAAALFAQAAAANAPIRVINVQPAPASVSAEHQEPPSVEMFATTIAANQGMDDVENTDAPQASLLCYEYGAKKGVRCVVCNRLYYDKSGFNKHLLRLDACARAKSFVKVIPREGYVIETSSSTNDNRSVEPFPVEVSSVAATLEMQVGRDLSQDGLQQQFVEEDEYGPKKGVRCLICNFVYNDKSAYNKHLNSRVDCERARSFRHVHKRLFFHEAEAQTAKAAFREADGVPA
jgi:hypothetical protein